MHVSPLTVLPSPAPLAHFLLLHNTTAHVCERVRAQTIYRRMQAKGSMLVNYSPMPEHGLTSFFRPVIIQAKVVEEDLVFMLDEIDRLGGNL